MGLRHFLNELEVKHGAILSVAISAVLVLMLPNGIANTAAAELSLAVTGILFGLVIGFYFNDMWERWRLVRDNIAIETSRIIGYLKEINIFAKDNKEWVEKQKSLIIKYIEGFFRYEWGEESPTQDEAMLKLGDSLSEARIKSEIESGTWESIPETYQIINEFRTKNNILGKDKLSTEEWTVVFILGSALLFALFMLKTSDIESLLFTALLTSATFILFFVIRDLSNLTVGEEEVTFEPYMKIYDAMGEPRHYWREDIKNGRVKPKEGKKYILYD